MPFGVHADRFDKGNRQEDAGSEGKERQQNPVRPLPSGIETESLKGGIFNADERISRRQH